MISYKVSKKLATEKGLDAKRLHIALNWLEPHSEAEATPERQEIVRQVLAGEFDVLPKGAISMRDKNHPDRFQLNYLYEKA